MLNFLLLLCPSSLTYDWQMGTVPLVQLADPPGNQRDVSSSSASRWLATSQSRLAITVAFYSLLSATALKAAAIISTNYCTAQWVHI